MEAGGKVLRPFYIRQRTLPCLTVLGLSRQGTVPCLNGDILPGLLRYGDPLDILPAGVIGVEGIVMDFGRIVRVVEAQNQTEIGVALLCLRQNGSC